MESEEIDISREIQAFLNAVCIATGIAAAIVVSIFVSWSFVETSSHRVEIERLRLAQMQYQQKEEVSNQ